jgi:hypothetical protein
MASSQRYERTIMMLRLLDSDPPPEAGGGDGGSCGGGGGDCGSLIYLSPSPETRVDAASTLDLSGIRRGLV